MILKEKSIQIGFIQKTHGVKGELSLALIDDLDFEDLEVDFLFLEIDNGLVPFYVESYRIKSSKSILVKLEGVDNEERALELCGTSIFADKDQLSALENAPSGSFVGYRVFDKTKGYIGTISGVMEISNNPLFSIDFEGKEILFPINPDFIIATDDQEETIQVDLPDGLIDLYLDNSNEEEEEEEDDFM